MAPLDPLLYTVHIYYALVGDILYMSMSITYIYNPSYYTCMWLCIKI